MRERERERETLLLPGLLQCSVFHVPHNIRIFGKIAPTDIAYIYLHKYYNSSIH